MERLTTESTTGFSSFFERTYVGVARSTALLVGEFGLGEELAQEAFTRVLERWDKMESEEHARRFVYRVAVNLGRSHHRRSWRLRTLTAANSRMAPDVADASDVRVEVERAMETLTPRQREILVLVDFSGYPAHEAAEVLGIRASTARVHLARARESVRAGLGGHP